MNLLPTLEEFFAAHGVMTQQPRIIRPFHRRIFQAITRWVAGELPDGRRNLAICIPPRHPKRCLSRKAGIVRYCLQTNRT